MWLFENVVRGVAVRVVADRVVRAPGQQLADADVAAARRCRDRAGAASGHRLGLREAEAQRLAVTSFSRAASRPASRRGRNGPCSCA